MGAAGGIARGNRVVRVGLAAAPGMTPLLPMGLRDTTEYLMKLCRSGVFGEVMRLPRVT